jgi:gliding motility-associated-like protein
MVYHYFKALLVSAGLCFFTCPAIGQTEDLIWVMDKNIGLDFRKGGEKPTIFKSSTLDFNHAGSTLYLEEYEDWLYTTGISKNSTIEYFYTTEVRNRSRVIASERLGFMTWYGLSGTLFLKHGKSIYLFSSCPDTSIDASSACQLLLSEFRYENNQPKVVLLNQVLSSESNCSIAVTRHANGLDWWVVTGGYYGNAFNVYLVNEAGITPLPLQVLGDPDNLQDAFGNTSAGFWFNNQGNLLAFGNRWVNPQRLCTVQFDRCSGQFSNRQILFLNTFPFKELRAEESHDIAFSPDDRFLYCSTRARLLAFDIASQTPNLPIVLDSLPEYRDSSWWVKGTGPMYSQIQNAPNGYIFGQISHFSFDSTLSFSRLDAKLPEQSKYLFSIAPDGTYNRKGLYIGDVGRAGSYMPNVPDYSLGPLVSAYAGPRMRRHVAVCTGGADSASLGRWADTRNLTYQWAPADGLSDLTSATPRAKPSRTTTYTLTVRALPHVDTACGGNRSWHSDTITVHVQALPAGLSLGPDRTVCDSVVVLSAGLDSLPTSLQLRWSTGDTTGSIKVRESGEYSAQMLVGNCPFSDSVAIRLAQPPALRLPTDTTWCPTSGPLLLRPYASTARSFRWSTGSTAPILSINTPGDYSLTIVDSLSCESSATVRVYARDSAQVNLPEDRTWCPSWGLLELRPDAPNARRYFWSTREMSPAILVSDTGMYWVRVVDEAGCVGTDSIRLSCPPLGASIDLLPALGDLHIPNAFSPNADGLNETFQLLCARCVYIELSIYDRWGRLVFSSDNLTHSWDGRHAPEGVYAYRVRYRLAGEGNDREGRGMVSVVR